MFSLSKTFQMKKYKSACSFPKTKNRCSSDDETAVLLCEEFFSRYYRG